MAADGHTYDAFMSYSHSTDSKLAPVLQGLIRRVGRRWYRRSALQVFRDETSLTMTEGLWESVRSAMASSRYFILMASPAAARSLWVQREISYWLATRGTACFFIVLTEGVIAWNEAAGDFDWTRTTALPRHLAPPPGVVDWPVRSLERWFRSEPLWENVTTVRGQVRRGQDNLRLRDAARTLAAPLYGMSKEQLDGEDERESRRFRRFRRLSFSGLVVLTVAAVVAAGFAFVQRNSALEQLRNATSRSIAAESGNLAARDPVLSARLALLAHGVAPSAQTAAALMDSVERNRHVLGYLEQAVTSTDGRDPVTGREPVSKVEISPDGRIVAAVSSQNGEVRLYDTASRKLLGTLPSERGGEGNVSPQLVFLDDERLAVLFSTYADVWDVTRLNRMSSTEITDGYVVTISPDGRWLAVAGDSTGTGDESGYQFDVTAPGAAPQLVGQGPGSVAVAVEAVTGRRAGRSLFPDLDSDFSDSSADGAVVAVLLDFSTVEMWDARSGTRLASRLLPGNPGWAAMSLSDDGSSVLVGNDLGELLQLDSDLGPPRAVGTLPMGVRSVALGPNGGTGVAVDDSGTMALLAPSRDQRFDVLPGVIGSTVGGDPEQPSLVAGPDGRWLALERDTTVALWDIEDRRLVTEIAVDDRAGGPRVAFNADGSRFATTEAGRVVTRELPSLREVAAEAAGNPLDVARAMLRGLGNAQLARTDDGGETRIWAVGATGERVVAAVPTQDAMRDVSVTSQGSGGVVVVTTNPTVDGDPGKRTLTAFDLSGSDAREIGSSTAPGIFYYMAVGDRGRRVVLERSVLDMTTGAETPLRGGDGSYADIGTVLTDDDRIVVRHTGPTRDATGTIRNNLLVWDASEGVLIGQWPEPMSTQYAGQQSAQVVRIGEGRVATVRPDGSVAIWTVSPRAWVQRLCGLLGELGAPERDAYLGDVEAEDVCTP